MWFKKKSVLQTEGHYYTEKSADGSTDMRTTYKGYTNSDYSINSGLPSVADADNYFYLPALGQYYSGKLSYVGIDGKYWSSSAIYWFSGDGSYYLSFDISSVSVDINNRHYGYRVGGFE